MESEEIELVAGEGHPGDRFFSRGGPSVDPLEKVIGRG
jgi:hypothetical protein